MVPFGSVGYGREGGGERGLVCTIHRWSVQMFGFGRMAGKRRVFLFWCFVVVVVVPGLRVKLLGLVWDFVGVGSWVWWVGLVRYGRMVWYGGSSGLDEMGGWLEWLVGSWIGLDGTWVVPGLKGECVEMWRCGDVHYRLVL